MGAEPRPGCARPVPGVAVGVAARPPGPPWGHIRSGHLRRVAFGAQTSLWAEKDQASAIKPDRNRVPRLVRPIARHAREPVGSLLTVTTTPVASPDEADE